MGALHDRTLAALPGQAELGRGASGAVDRHDDRAATRQQPAAARPVPTRRRHIRHRARPSARRGRRSRGRLASSGPNAPTVLGCGVDVYGCEYGEASGRRGAGGAVSVGGRGGGGSLCTTRADERQCGQDGGEAVRTGVGQVSLTFPPHIACRHSSTVCDEQRIARQSEARWAFVPGTFCRSNSLTL